MSIFKKARTIPKVGIDSVSISRFRDLLVDKNEAFFSKTFSDSELSYARQFADSATHFAGMFAAKEAVSKSLGVSKYPYITIVVLHREDGLPEAYSRASVEEGKAKKLPVSISITHTEDVATAIAIG